MPEKTTIDCPMCDGTGERDGEECNFCEGLGYIVSNVDEDDDEEEG